MSERKFSVIIIIISTIWCCNLFANKFKNTINCTTKFEYFNENFGKTNNRRNIWFSAHSHTHTFQNINRALINIYTIFCKSSVFSFKSSIKWCRRWNWNCFFACISMKNENDNFHVFYRFNEENGEEHSHTHTQMTKNMSNPVIISKQIYRDTKFIRVYGILYNITKQIILVHLISVSVWRNELVSMDRCISM